VVFCRLALKVLPERAAIISAIFFVTSHLVTQVATAIQPESLMLLLYLLAVYYFVDWYEGQSWISYSLAMISFASAMLVKSPAAHLAIFFLLWALHKDRVKAFRRPSLYLFAILSFAPVFVWYAHAASLWHQFHNSMGVSNEDHWFGLDILRRPKVFANLAAIDVVLVCGVGGAIIAVVSLARNRLKTAVNQLAFYWWVAICIYLLVIIRTAGAYWASYYHVIAIPPTALLFGAGIYQLRVRGTATWKWSLISCSITAAFLSLSLSRFGERDVTHLPGVVQDLVAAHSPLAELVVLSVLSMGATVLCLLLGPSATSARPRSRTVIDRFTPLLVASCFTYFFVSLQLLLGTWKTFGSRSPQFISAESLKAGIAPNTLIVASGGPCSDPGGHRVASNAPNVFYWLDRKGFTTCEGQESISQLKSMAKHGARYFIANKLSLIEQPGFESELRNSFSLLADGDTLLLFNLQSRLR
jgi:4-amino-4-deoxy-L-arabinose transferase-like glycosyltransferase